MSTEPSGDAKSGSHDSRLPFEPRQKRKKSVPNQPEPAQSKTTKRKNTSSKTTASQDQPNTTSKESMAIPEVVSKRMVRRMALLCGVPSVLGISTFFVSYFLITSLGLKLPHIAVVLVSMGFFGLGVFGLTYGVLSASWDEETPGTLLGWQEFTLNLGRMTAAWRSAGQKD